MKKLLGLFLLTLFISGCGQNVDQLKTIPSNKYLLIEVIEKKKVPGMIPVIQECPSQYFFENGVLRYYQPQFEFNNLQKVVLARSTSVLGRDDGENKCDVLTDIRKMPFYNNGLGINKVLAKGAVIVEYNRQVIYLKPGQRWNKLDRDGLTSIYAYIINHGFCDKSLTEKIQPLQETKIPKKGGITAVTQEANYK